MDKIKLMAITIIISISLSSLALSHTLVFNTSTSVNGTIAPRNWTIINMTFDDDSGLGVFKLNWNGTNYSFYDDSLVLALSLNNNSLIGDNSTFSLDASKYGNNGTFYDANLTNSDGNTVPYYSSGRFGSSLVFDGTDDYVDAGEVNSLNPGSSDVTYMAWFKTDITGEQAIISFSGGTGWDAEGLYFLGVDWDGKLKINLNRQITGTYYPMLVKSSQVVSDGNWHFCAFTFNYSAINTELFLDGVYQGNSSNTSWEAPLTQVGRKLGIGVKHYNTNDGSFFNGSIDEVRIYNRSLSSQEIFIHYQSEIQKFNSTEWRLYANITNRTDGSYSYSGWANDTSGNSATTDNGNLRYISLYAPISSCGNLSVSNKIYFLDSNVSSGTSCFNATANNVTLDCQGYTINYSQSATGYAFNSNSYNYTTVRNCRIVQGGNSSYSYGIYIPTSSNSTAKNNNITTIGADHCWGISISSSNYSNASFNIIITNGTDSDGIYLSGTSLFNNLSGNSIYLNGSNGWGITLWGTCNYNNLSNNTIHTNATSGDGIVLASNAKFNNLFLNNISTKGPNSYGVYLYSNCSDNNISNNTIKSLQSYGIYTMNGSVNSPSNNTIHNNLINGSARPVLFSTVFDQNYWNISNQTGNRTYSSGNNIGGNYYTNSSGTGFSDTCTDVDRDGFCDSSYNVSNNFACSGATCGNNTDYLTLSDEFNIINISSCWNMNKADTTYVLTQNVSSAGTCFNVTANNMTLDCKGFTINYSQSGLGYAVNNTGYNYTTIKNCVIFQGSNDIYSDAIHFTNAAVGGLIFNNSITTFGNRSEGVFFNYSSDYMTVENNTINLSGISPPVGVYGYSSSFANIVNNTILGINQSEYGSPTFIYSLYFYNCYNSTVINNTAENVYNGVCLDYSSGFNISGNKIKSYGDALIIYSEYNNSSYYNHSLDTSNTEYGEPIYYYKNLSNSVIENISDIGMLYLYAGNNVTIRNMIMDRDGIFIEYIPNLSVYNNTISINNEADSVNGIIIDSSDRANISDNTISNMGYYGYGIILGDSANSTISVNRISTNGTYGIGIDLYASSMYNNITGNNISTNSSDADGIYFYTSSNYNRISGNSISTNASTADCIYVTSSSRYNNISNNSFSTNGSSAMGIYVRSSSNYNNFTNNIISTRGSSGYGIYVYSSANYNNFSYNNISTNGSSGHAIHFYYSSGNIIYSNRLQTNRSSAYGIYLRNNSDNNTIVNSIVMSNLSYAIYFNNDTVNKPENNTIYNCLLNGSVLTVNGTAGWTDIFNYWNTTNQTGSRIYLGGNRIGGNYYTNKNGTGFSDTCDDTDKDGFCDSSYNVSTNSTCSGATCGNNTDYLTLSDEVNPISTCFNFTIPNKYYILSNNVSSYGSCMNITANNITLDCQGYTINYSQSEVGYAFNNSGGYNYTTVRDCNIVQGGASPNSYAVYLYPGADNATIDNNTISTHGIGSFGIYVFGAYYSLVSNNSINTSGVNGWGVRVYNSLGTRIYYNNITTTGLGGYGVEIDYSPPVNLTGNQINSLNSSAIECEVSVSSQHNQYIDTSNTERGEPIYYYYNLNSQNIENLANIGILYITASNNLSVRNITLDKDGITFRLTENSTVEDCNITTSEGDGSGILLRRYSKNNTLSNNSITTSGITAHGIFLTDSSSNNNLTNNSVTTQSSESRGIRIYGYSDNNTVSGNLISTYGIATAYGLELEHNVSGNNITGNSIRSTNTHAVYIMTTSIPSGYIPENNFIYNNLINGSVTPVGFNEGSNRTNYWNISIQSGTRAYSSGTNIGGNYYTNSTGTGFSDNCTDTNGNGFCDSSYNVSTNTACTSGVDCGNNTDYLTLSDEYGKLTDCANLSVANTTYYLQNNVSSSGTCMNISADNVTLDCNGFTINYSLSSVGYAISNIGYNYTTIKNCTLAQNSTSSSSYGIFFNNSNYGNITNNSIYTKGLYGYGVYLSNSSRNNIISNLMTNSSSANNYEVGVYLYTDSNFNNVSFNRITTPYSWSYGIYLYSNSNNTISSNNITTNGVQSHGIYLYLSINGNLTENKINTSSGRAINVEGSSISYFNHSIDTTNTEKGEPVYYYFNNNNSIIENMDNIGLLIVGLSQNVTVRNITLDKDGIEFYYVYNSSIYNVSIINVSGDGIYLGSSQRINMSSNDISVSCAYGYSTYLYGSSNNNISNTSMSSYGSNSHGLYIRNAVNSSINSNYIYSNRSYGIYVYLNSNYNRITNSTIISNSSNAVYFYNSTTQYPENNTLYNNFFYGYSLPINGTSGWENLSNSWNATNQSGARIYGSGDRIGGNYYTNSTGNGFSDTCNDLDNDGFCDSPYNISSNSSCVVGSTCGNGTDYLTLSDEFYIKNISSCWNMNKADTTYVLTQNVSSAGTCFNVTANNMTLDCNGFKIIYSNSALGYGVNNSGGYNYTTIGNCTIVQGSNQTGSYAIYFNRSNNGTVRSNVIHTYGQNGYGIYLRTSSGSNNISNNTVYTNGSSGIGFYSEGSYNNISSNTIFTNGSGSHGIYAYSNYTTISSNVVESYGSGIYLSNSYGNNLSLNNVSSYDSQGIPVTVNSFYNIISLNNVFTNKTSDGYAISLQTNASFNSVSENNITTNGSYGIGILLYSNATYNNLSYNKISTNSSGSYAVLLEHNCSYNNISHNNIITNGSSGFGIWVYNRSLYNNVLYNNVYTNGASGYGIYISLISNYNNLTNNIVYANSSNGYGIYLFNGSLGNIISNSTITSRQSYGIYLRNDSNNVPSNNTFYNNLINGSSLSVGFSSGFPTDNSGFNFWNSSNQTGTRTYSNGNIIGGNYYTNSTGNGFSDTCEDVENDGLCDFSYNINTNSACSGATCGNNTDYLALSDNYNVSETFWISTKNGGEFAILINSTTYNATASGNINDGNWHHIAATYDGFTMKIYVDGVLKATNTSYSGKLAGQGIFRAGTDSLLSPGKFFNGSIDEMKILNYTLSEAEIFDDYKKGMK